MGIRKKEMSTAFLGARGGGVLRVYIKIKDGTISGRVVGVYHGLKNFRLQIDGPRIEAIY